MSKVYVLTNETVSFNCSILALRGIVSKKGVADIWRNLEKYNEYRILELDDPELLNRIAKESEKKIE